MIVAGEKAKLTIRNKYDRQRRYTNQSYSCEVEVLRVLPQSAWVKLPNGMKKCAPLSQLSEVTK